MVFGRKSNNTGVGKIAVIIIILLAIIVLGGLVFAWVKFTPGELSRQKVIENYYKSVSNEDVKLYKDTCYTKKWQKNYNSAGTGIDQKIKDSFAYESGATYGKVTITVMEKLDKEYAEKMTDQIRVLYGADVKVSNITKINFSVDSNFEGEKQTSGTITRYCYKSGLKWYFLAASDVVIALEL